MGCMTCKELIIYILENGLENEPIIQNGTFVGLIPIDKAAVKFEVGIATIWAWITQGKIPYVTINGWFYIPANFEMPNEGIMGRKE